jgi:hypothetical protein
MSTCKGCGKYGAPICNKCADETNQEALRHDANGTKSSGIESRRMQEWSEQDDAALERQQLAAGYEHSSYGYDDAYGGDGDVFLPEDDYYDE